MDVQRDASFEACAETGLTGLTGVISLMIVDNIGGAALAASTVGIIETPAGSGNYCAVRTAPATSGHYTLVWSTDGSFDQNSLATEDLFVLAAVTVLPPLVPGMQESGPFVGPCSAWTTSEDVADCCNAGVGSDFTLLDSSVTAASQLLYELSAHQFGGICSRVVRPCSEPCGGCSWNGSGFIYHWDGAIWFNSECGPHCGCSPLSEVVLPNYPVTEILEVLIDGVPVDPSEYRLDQWSRLVRMRDADGERTYWPSCQNIDANSTEEGTFEVTYAFGVNPPQAGIEAAKELACQVFLACSRDGAVTGDCLLPAGTTRITRQGVTIEKGAFAAWGYVPASAVSGGRAAGWQTGLPLVDLFLNAYNPNGLRRRPMAWTPDTQPYAKEVGVVGS